MMLLSCLYGDRNKDVQVWLDYHKFLQWFVPINKIIMFIVYKTLRFVLEMLRNDMKQLSHASTTVTI